jgi:hypothetical protein
MSEKQNKVAELARRKKCPNPHDRLSTISRGIEEGKTNRQIARDLGCDEATVRRDLKKLALPPEQLAAIQEGDSAEKYLNDALLRQTGIDRRARDKIGRRRREDQESGKHSESLADALLDWLSTKSPSDSDIALVLKGAMSQSEFLTDGELIPVSRKFGHVVAPLERHPSLGYRRTATEPDFLDQCTRELVRSLVRVEPAQVVRQSALKKAKAKVDARGHWTDGLVSRSKKAEAEKDRIAKRRKARDGNEA